MVTKLQTHVGKHDTLLLALVMWLLECSNDVSVIISKCTVNKTQ